jgi:hypothetical protein
MYLHNVAVFHSNIWSSLAMSNFFAALIPSAQSFEVALSQWPSGKSLNLPNVLKKGDLMHPIRPLLKAVFKEWKGNEPPLRFIDCV